MHKIKLNLTNQYGNCGCNIHCHRITTTAKKTDTASNFVRSVHHSRQSESMSGEHTGMDAWPTKPIFSFQSWYTQHHRPAVCYPSSTLSVHTLLQLPCVQLAIPNIVNNDNNNLIIWPALQENDEQLTIKPSKKTFTVFTVCIDIIHQSSFITNH